MRRASFPLVNFTADILEHQGNGRLLASNRKPKLRGSAQNLCFANGVAVSPINHSCSWSRPASTDSPRVAQRTKARPVGNLCRQFTGFSDGILSNGKDKFWLAAGYATRSGA